MKFVTLAAAAVMALGMAACSSPEVQQAEAQADAIEQQAGNADGGATTENTPNTSPSNTTE